MIDDQHSQMIHIIRMKLSNLKAMRLNLCLLERVTLIASVSHVEQFLDTHFLSRRSIRGRRTDSASMAALLPLAGPFICTSSWFICFTQSSITGLKLGERKHHQTWSFVRRCKLAPAGPIRALKTCREQGCLLFERDCLATCWAL